VAEDRHLNRRVAVRVRRGEHLRLAARAVACAVVYRQGAEARRGPDTLDADLGQNAFSDVPRRGQLEVVNSPAPGSVRGGPPHHRAGADDEVRVAADDVYNGRVVVQVVPVARYTAIERCSFINDDVDEVRGP
jgi:hypothetical protein